MYTTVKKYQFGMEEIFHVNTAILETLKEDNNKTAMVIHAYQRTFLVEQDLGKKYNLDETILLYQTRELSNFRQFKAGAAPKPVCAPNVFMLNITTGLWQQRYPNQGDAATRFLDRCLNIPDTHDEAWCVHDMQNEVTNPGSYVIRGYCRPVPAGYSKQGMMHADMMIVMDDDYEVAQRYFNSAFQISNIRWQNQKAKTL